MTKLRPVRAVQRVSGRCELIPKDRSGLISEQDAPTLSLQEAIRRHGSPVTMAEGLAEPSERLQSMQ